jgi:hypothetical protein
MIVLYFSLTIIRLIVTFKKNSYIQPDDGDRARFRNVGFQPNADASDRPIELYSYAWSLIA